MIRTSPLLVGPWRKRSPVFVTTKVTSTTSSAQRKPQHFIEPRALCEIQHCPLGIGNWPSLLGLRRHLVSCSSKALRIRPLGGYPRAAGCNHDAVLCCCSHFRHEMLKHTGRASPRHCPARRSYLCEPRRGGLSHCSCSRSFTASGRLLSVAATIDKAIHIRLSINIERSPLRFCAPPVARFRP